MKNRKTIRTAITGVSSLVLLLGQGCKPYPEKQFEGTLSDGTQYKLLHHLDLPGHSQARMLYDMNFNDGAFLRMEENGEVSLYGVFSPERRWIMNSDQYATFQQIPDYPIEKNTAVNNTAMRSGYMIKAQEILDSNRIKIKVHNK